MTASPDDRAREAVAAQVRGYGSVIEHWSPLFTSEGGYRLMARFPNVHAAASWVEVATEAGPDPEFGPTMCRGAYMNDPPQTFDQPCTVWAFVTDEWLRWHAAHVATTDAQDVRDALDHEPWNGDNAHAVDVARLNRIARPAAEPTAEPLWCVVITDAGRPVPTVIGPFATETEARRYEDRYVDAPAGAWASFVPMWAPGDVVVLAE